MPRKVLLRLIPFLFVLYVVAYLDRINVSFAALQDSFPVSPRLYGWGFGVFFVGYFLFEVPSNLIMERTGARAWIARIMVTWGLVSAGMMFINGPRLYFGLRFLLGVAEAGFFPGMILYLTYWFPRSERAGAVAWFMTATSVSGVIGGPISGWLLGLNGYGGLAGWQWLFLLEGLPAVALGVAVWFYLCDRPEQARWLDDEEREWLVTRMRADEDARAGAHGTAFLTALRTPQVWLFCLIYFTLVIGFYGIGSWLPKIIKASGVRDDAQVGLLSAIPNFVSVLAMVAVGISSDRSRERRWHVALSALVGAAGLLACAFSVDSTVLVVVSLSIALAGLRSTLGPFWALPTSVLAGTAAAGGIAFINSVGNLGGLVGPSAYSELMARFNHHAFGLCFLAGSLVVSAGLVLCVPPGRKAGS